MQQLEFARGVRPGRGGVVWGRGGGPWARISGNRILPQSHGLQRFEKKERSWAAQPALT